MPNDDLVGRLLTTTSPDTTPPFRARFVNPDGPEAAARIGRDADHIADLERENAGLREALEAISAQGDRQVSDAGAAMEMLRIARTALTPNPRS